MSTLFSSAEQQPFNCRVVVPTLTNSHAYTNPKVLYSTAPIPTRHDDNLDVVVGCPRRVYSIIWLTCVQYLYVGGLMNDVGKVNGLIIARNRSINHKL